MKETNRNVSLYCWNGFYCIIERIKNDIYGNPRYDIIIIQQDDIWYNIRKDSIDTYIDKPIRITSYNILKDIQEYLDNYYK